MDLFSSQNQLEKLSLPDAELYYLPRLDFVDDADAILEQLISEIAWQEDTIQIFGNQYVQPRLSAWIGDEDSAYTYSGLTLSPKPWTPLLTTIRKGLEAICQSDFNSVLLNYYRNERDGMGMHSDDESELGPQPVIASVTFGEERDFILKHKNKKNISTQKLKLKSGSLLIMKGDTQKYWKHGINKLKRPCGPRVNLTFRKIFANFD